MFILHAHQRHNQNYTLPVPPKLLDNNANRQQKKGVLVYCTYCNKYLAPTKIHQKVPKLNQFMSNHKCREQTNTYHA